MFFATLLSTTLASSAAAMTYLYPPPAQRITNIWSEEPCSLRAWVRAQDLTSDSISYGELRVKLLQPCMAQDVDLQHIGLELRLDEFVEVARMVSPEIALDVPPWQWLQPGKSQHSDWTTWKRNVTTFKTESVLHTFSSSSSDVQQMLTPEGLVLPFSVLLPPDAAFPAGVFPLTFHAHSDDDRSQTMLGRAYRYVAFITHRNGTREGSSAGYTSFVPSPPPVPSPSSVTEAEEVTVIARAVRRRLDDDEEDLCARTEAELHDDLPVRVVFPRGRDVYQGQELLVELSFPGDDVRTEVDASLVTTVLFPEREPQTTTFSELRTFTLSDASSYSRPSARVSYTGSALRIRVFVPSTFPTASTSSFAVSVGASLRLSFTRLHSPSTYAPIWGTESDFLPPDYEANDGWSYGECDRFYRHTTRYEVLIPLVLPRPSTLSTVHAPRIIAGHGPATKELDLKQEVQTEVYDDEVAGTRDLEGFPWPVNDILGFVGVYVGPLWERRERKFQVLIFFTR
ncbi:hypothetical protein EXIGLDRAFT_694749 [Exidia glandulosa HHB12029]|uniref:Arrestin-like N-terminal domain-containing protein n=1 Tax=Exidia glandulosa HHB12029 TaxID=1314781 RepID=A0A165NHW5_EXIGL|nr:hypothetical protein EXIGLDRAFT_694749 [Exidia glandulosa HHB12029]